MNDARSADIEALVEIVESGWEDEPTEADILIAQTIGQAARFVTLTGEYRNTPSK